MLTTAILADAASFFISLIPFIGQVFNPVLMFVFSLSLWLWLAFNGLGLKGAIGGSVSMIVEIIPILQILPPFTLMVIAIYLRHKVTEKIPLKALKKAT